MNAPSHQSTPWLALGATFAVALAAALLGGPATTARPVAAPWLAAIESGGDHIDADELARELLAARGDVRLVDVRTAAEFAAFHLPGAVHLTLPELCGEAGEQLFAAAPRLVVLYGQGATHAGQAWVELRRRGHTNVRVLAAGLDGFTAAVLTPPSLRPGAHPAAAHAAAPDHRLERAFLLGDGSTAPAAGASWASDPPRLTAPALVSPAWLQAHAAEVVVVDVRAEAGALRLPGSVPLPLPTLRQHHGDRDLLLHDAAALAARFGALGIGADTPVVVASEATLHDAALAALAFLRTGHRAVGILEGGLLRWASERRPLVAEAPAPRAAVDYAPRPGADDFTITTAALAAALGSSGPLVVDVRPTAAFRGEVSTEPRAGHIPGARNRPLAADRPTTGAGWLRPRAELQAAYAELGASGNREVVVSCRTGHQAAATWFVLRHLLGLPNVRWYNGSWTEWAADPALPIETGEGRS